MLSVLDAECIESWHESNRFGEVLVLVVCSFALENLLSMSLLLSLLLLEALLFFPLLVRYLRVGG